MSKIDWTARLHPDKALDHRTVYERDYARVVHSAAFRRLQAKTQVLGVGEGDFYRTRLTHSMEVSQIGVSITKKLFREMKAYDDLRALLPPPMLMSTICLAHDLGHPPFGHGGEVALNRCMLPYGGFEGNGQTLRIATKLEPYHEQQGMNLTRRSVLGLIKYPARYSDVINWTLVPGNKPAQIPKEASHERYEMVPTPSSIFVADDYKPPKCYLDEEHDDVVLGWVAKEVPNWNRFSEVFSGKKGKHGKTKFKSLDTSIMELADDIAYGIHDLEDGISLKLVTPEKFHLWFNKLDADTGKKRSELLAPFLDKYHNGEMGNFSVALFLKDTQTRKHEIGRLVGFFVDQVTLNDQGETKFRENLLRWNAELPHLYSEALRVLKAVVVDLMIKNTAVQQLEFKGQKIVTELFGAFSADPKRLLDERDFKKTTQGGGGTATPRVICDYIAGMTDDYATKRYQQLFSPRVGSVFDRL